MWASLLFLILSSLCICSSVVVGDDVITTTQSPQLHTTRESHLLSSRSRTTQELSSFFALLDFAFFSRRNNRDLEKKVVESNESPANKTKTISCSRCVILRERFPGAHYGEINWKTQPFVFWQIKLYCYGIVLDARKGNNKQIISNDGLRSC